MVVGGRRGRRRKRRDVPASAAAASAAAADRPTGCESGPVCGAGTAGLTRSGGCEDWENGEGRGWTSVSTLPQAGTEERWGAKRGEGERGDVRLLRG